MSNCTGVGVCVEISRCTIGTVSVVDESFCDEASVLFFSV